MRKLFLFILAALLTACATQESSNSSFSADDQMFAAMMIPHHEQAIQMSELALLNSTDPEILALASEIKAAQAPEIEQMKNWGSSMMGSHAGHMMDEGMLSDDEMAQLKDAKGAEFDRLFLEGMIKHHQGAIEMADMIIDSANDEAALLGKNIVESQSAEIERMRLLLSR
ncbi:MAG: DUF305 domain-containing protein [Acidobacteria bacterium]|nr:DUF305 domain-containing protein [Acidobacteriota bacterium]